MIIETFRQALQNVWSNKLRTCLLYTSDAADDIGQV